MAGPEPPASDPALRPAAQLLVLEGEALLGLVDPLTAEDFDLPTACARWSVRDVLAHCSAVLHRLVAGTGGLFNAQENQQDVGLRGSWTTERVIEELARGCAKAPIIIHRFGGGADAFALGVWVHGGDIRAALGRPDAYASAGAELAVPLICARSVQRSTPAVEVVVDGVQVSLGSGQPVGRLATDMATFVRLVGGRKPDAARFELEGKVTPQDLLLFS